MITRLNAQTAMQAIEQAQALEAALKEIPVLVPVVQEILGPLFNSSGHGEPSQPMKRQMSAARRAQLSRAAKARWRKAKKAGKRTIGGAD